MSLEFPRPVRTSTVGGRAPHLARGIPQHARPAWLTVLAGVPLSFALFGLARTAVGRIGGAGTADVLLPWFVLIAGLASTLLISGLFFLLASSRREAEAIAREMTQSFQKREASLSDDITARKLAEQELVESRALLNDAQKLAHVGCCQYSPLDGRVIWSDELYRIHGVEPESFSPSFASAMKFVHPLDRGRWADTVASALRGAQRFTSEFRLIRADGKVRHVLSLGEVMKDATGRPLRVLWSVLDVTDQKQTEEALRASAEQLKALSRRLVEIQEAERRQLSRELHDRVGQNLTALSINLDMLHTGLSGEQGAEHRRRLSDSSALLEATVDSIENVMAELRPPMLDDYGLLPALHWYAKDFSRRTGIAVTVSGSDTADRVAAETEITFFRIAQEALTNVARHARAARAEIVFEHAATHCLMTVADNGIGLDRAPERETERRPGLGMVTMRERAQAIGASFVVRTLPDGGTEVAVRIP
jgi:two-component system sensor histidine kinase UhpB